VDSNRFGPVPEDQVVGTVLFRYWPRPKVLFTERSPRDAEGPASSVENAGPDRG
jgi:hypothetical protein